MNRVPPFQQHAVRRSGATSWRLVLGGLVLVSASTTAHADAFEARWSARPFAGAARMRESGTTSDVFAPAAGGALSLSYGLSNRLDVGVEVLALTAMPTFDGAIESNGFIATGDYQRQSSSALVLLGPTWRFGPGWSPVISIGAGGGKRYRSEGTFVRTGLVPEGRRATDALDLAFSARAGVERRVNRRFTVGAYGGLLTAWAPNVPPLALASISVGVSYVYYPTFAP